QRPDSGFLSGKRGPESGKFNVSIAGSLKPAAIVDNMVCRFGSADSALAKAAARFAHRLL
ncbi:MAG: hypothetical protein ACOC54_04590, partial [Candidatus Sumerlaeota bacterium]